MEAKGRQEHQGFGIIPDRKIEIDKMQIYDVVATMKFWVILQIFAFLFVQRNDLKICKMIDEVETKEYQNFQPNWS